MIPGNRKKSAILAAFLLTIGLLPAGMDTIHAEDIVIDGDVTLTNGSTIETGDSTTISGVLSADGTSVNLDRATTNGIKATNGSQINLNESEIKGDIYVSGGSKLKSENTVSITANTISAKDAGSSIILDAEDPSSVYKASSSLGGTAKDQIQVLGGTLQSDNFRTVTKNAADGSILLKGHGVLQTKAGELFSSTGSLDNKKLDIQGGTILLDNASYSETFLTSARNAMNRTKAWYTMSGTDTDGSTLDVSKATSNSKVLRDKVTISSSGKNLVVGMWWGQRNSFTEAGTYFDKSNMASAAKGFRASKLNLGKNSTGLAIIGNTAVTLGSSQGGDLITVNNASSKVNIAVGTSVNRSADANLAKEGKLYIGDQAVGVGKNYKLTGDVYVNKGSLMETLSGNLTQTGNLYNYGTVTLDSGASLDVQNLKVYGTDAVNLGKDSLLKAKTMTVQKGASSTFTGPGQMNITTLNMNGGSLALNNVYSQINKLSLTGGTLNLNGSTTLHGSTKDQFQILGGTLKSTYLRSAAKDTVNSSILLKNQGVLQTKTSQLFSSTGSLDNTKLDIQGGTILLDDATYSESNLSKWSNAMGKTKAWYTMSGTDTDGSTLDISKAISNPKVLRDKVTISSNKPNLVVGMWWAQRNSFTEAGTYFDKSNMASAAKGFRASKLNLGKNSTGLAIIGNTAVTLGGSQGGDLITVNNASSKVNIAVGTSVNRSADANLAKEGKLYIGDQAVGVGKNYKLTGNIYVNKGSLMETLSGNLTQTGNLYNYGTVTLDSGTSLNVQNLNLFRGGTMNVGNNAHLKTKTTTISGGTLKSDNLREAAKDNADGSIVLKDQGVLQTNSSQIFTSSGVIDNAKVNIQGGTILLDDASHNESNLSKWSNAMGKTKAWYTMSGTDTDGSTLDISKAISNPKVLRDKVTISSNKPNLVVGMWWTQRNSFTEAGTYFDKSNMASAAKGFRASKLNLGKNSTGLAIIGNTAVTLGGSQGGDLITVNNASSKVNIAVGTSVNRSADANLAKEGKLYIGDQAIGVGKNYKLTGDVYVNKGSLLETLSGNLTQTGNLYNYGTVTLDSGTSMNLQNLKLYRGSFLKLNKSSALKTAGLTVPKNQIANISGTGSWTMNGDSTIDGQLRLNNYSGTLTFGSGSSLHVVKDNAYILQGKQGSLVFGPNSSVYTTAEDDFVNPVIVKAEGSSASISVNPASRLFVTNAETGYTYDFSDVIENEDGSSAVTALPWQKVYGSSTLMVGEKVDDTHYSFSSATTSTLAKRMPRLMAPAAYLAAARASDPGEGTAAAETAQTIQNTFGPGMSDEASSHAANHLAGLSGLAGISHGLYSFTSEFNRLTDLHSPKEGEVWAGYLRKDEDADHMKIGSLKADYDLTYNGIIAGYDFAHSKHSTTGAALSIANGKVTTRNDGLRTRNDVDYSAIDLYHSIDLSDWNLKFDLGYIHSKNDMRQNNVGRTVTAKTDADALTAGIRAEKIIARGNNLWKPFAAIHYMHLKVDDFKDSEGFGHGTDSADIWTMPVGLSFEHRSTCGGWKLTPHVEAGYLFAAGDKDVDETFSYNGTSGTFGMDIAESSFFVSGGLKAESGRLSLNAYYGYQKGDDSHSRNWGLQLGYRF